MISSKASPKIYRVHFDQIEMSFKCALNEILEAFSTFYGSFKKGIKRNIYNYAGNITIRHEWEYGRNIVTFPGTRENFETVFKIAQNIPINTISSAEIAFDIIETCKTLDEAVIYRERLIDRMRPRHGQRIVRKERSGKSQLRGDVINGDKTHYFFAETENIKNNTGIHRQMPDYWESASKVYAKQLGGVWHIRCEITLRRKALERRFPGLSKVMSQNQLHCIDLIFDRLDALEFYDFWQLLNVDCEGFRDRARQIARRKISKQKYPILLNSHLAHLTSRIDKRLINQLKFMKAVSRRIKSKVLEQAILKEYTTELTLEEALNRPLFKEADTVD